MEVHELHDKAKRNAVHFSSGEHTLQEQRNGLMVAGVFALLTIAEHADRIATALEARNA